MAHLVSFTSYISLQNLSDLDINLSKSLKMKCNGDMLDSRCTYEYLIRTGAGDILSAAWAKRAHVECSGQHWLGSALHSWKSNPYYQGR